MVVNAFPVLLKHGEEASKNYFSVSLSVSLRNVDFNQLRFDETSDVFQDSVWPRTKSHETTHQSSLSPFKVWGLLNRHLKLDLN